ncbi:MAG: phosphoglycerate dehydrogenase [Varibaculum sp.]|nr:phosphoglycerate dehydrogenase [Varibaculum sp.]
MTKILLLENPHQVADEHFADAQDLDINVERIEGSLDAPELIERLQGKDIVGIRSKTNITEQVLDACPQLQVVATFSIGTNQIDIPACTKRGIAIFNAPYSNTRSVVELVISDIVALQRRMPEKNAQVHRGEWEKSATGSHEVRGKTLGIIGYGSIGTQLSVVAEALGMNVIFYDLQERLAIGNATKLNSMEDVLRNSDYISLHIDGRPSNNNLIGEKEFAMMRDGAVFINLARGQVVDIDALAAALESGKISGAAVDTYPTEPKKNGDPFESPLLKYPNTILTPHIGGSTLEAQESIGHFVSGKIVDYLRNGATDMSINFPNMTMEAHQDARYRIALFHRNVPGVLARLNALFAEQNVNINGQLLGTQGEYGYVLADIASELPIEVIAAIRDREETIRLRVMEAPQA